MPIKSESILHSPIFNWRQQMVDHMRNQISQCGYTQIITMSTLNMSLLAQQLYTYVRQPIVGDLYEKLGLK